MAARLSKGYSSWWYSRRTSTPCSPAARQQRLLQVQSMPFCLPILNERNVLVVLCLLDNVNAGKPCIRL